MNKNYNKALRSLMYRIKNTWDVGKRIQSISVLSYVLNVPRYSIHKAIQYLCSKGYLEYRGREGIWVTSKPKDTLSLVMRNINNINTFKRYIKAASLLSNEAVFDRKETCIINNSADNITFFFPYTGKEKVININDIRSLIENPIQAEDIDINNKVLLQKYLNQQKAKDVIGIYLRNRSKIKKNYKGDT